ncbi:MAG: histidinol dehydrogenase [Verrucomicrobia bacterium]|nr:histidinol dehydrogenase [Verrucomicrobiota bacterium]
MLVLRANARDFSARLRSFVGSGDASSEVGRAVAGIVADVRRRGDAAVLDCTAKFDRVKLTAAGMRIPPAELARAARALPAAKRRAFEEAARCVLDFHRRTLPMSWTARNPHGATVGERHLPIRRCGLYVPGGQVPLVSTVLMTALPAKVAGVPEVCACTPPGPDGRINPDILAALHLCGVREVYAVGGAQAVAALAFGTRTVRAVDKVFGPGNAFVTEAKRQLFGAVGVDLLPGPSEVMVIADAKARADWVAADLCAQAEHGSGKEKLYLVAESRAYADRVLREARRQSESLRHGAKVVRALEKSLCVILVRRAADAAEAANLVAPEHLQLMVRPAAERRLAKKITTAGAMLLGPLSPTVLGDFTAGPSHTLPTGGTGRFFSGLRVTDFLRRTSLVRYDRASLRRAAAVVEAFSGMESLDAHGRSLKVRLGR